MADTAASPESTAVPTAPATGNNKRLILVVVASMLVAGGLAVAFVGPAYLQRSQPAAAARREATAQAESPAGEEGAGEGSKGEGHGAGAATTKVIENILVNPAGTGGARFLMASVGIVAADTASAALVASHEAELRDVIISYLGAQSVEQLLDIAGRDSLKAALQRALTASTKGMKIRRVFFSQYAIQ